jgi:ribosomal protein S18 acetylase RimI-like enzyme
MRPPRWRTLTEGEVETTVARLEATPGPGLEGRVRHMFALATLESHGPRALRVATDDERWGLAVVFAGRLVVPCGDPAVIAAAGPPTRRWRLLVGDAAAADAVLADEHVPGLRIHVQRYMTVEPERVPDRAELPDPGLRRARPADVETLARLAVRLHVDDRFGPDPGRSGQRAYARRIAEGVERGLVDCVGPVGAPTVKIERSVSSRSYGVQLAGIVVEPEQRGAGLGSAAVAEAVRRAQEEWPGTRPVSLHVRADNAPAIRAYEHAGFVDREEWRLAVRA